LLPRIGAAFSASAAMPISTSAREALANAPPIRSVRTIGARVQQRLNGVLVRIACARCANLERHVARAQPRCSRDQQLPQNALVRSHS
jgi:hypothetical protein